MIMEVMMSEVWRTEGEGVDCDDDDGSVGVVDIDDATVEKEGDNWALGAGGGQIQCR